MLIAFHKPWGVLSQFTPDHPGQRTLAEFGLPSGVWPVGRLDADSEGLLLLTDEKDLVDRLLNPRRGHPRTYWAQVEGLLESEALAALQRGGLDLRGHRTAPCRARLLETEPDLPARDPPVRHRLTVPTAWIELTLTEGKNRQVRRMTAAVGHPTLRLVRVGVGHYMSYPVEPGKWRVLEAADRNAVLGGGAKE